MTVDPLLRGIYYMYLNNEPPELRDDLEATFELIKIWQLINKKLARRGPLISLMYEDREVFVEELVRRNGRDRPQS